MVAHAKAKHHLRQIPPANLDPGEPLQAAFNPGVKKQFTLKRTGLIRHPKTGRHLREFLLTDQFGNFWITYLAICADMEVHQWPTDRNAYIKPSMQLAHNGISADLMDKFRQAAFTIFDRQDKAVEALRSIANKSAGKIVVDFDKLTLPPAPDLKASPKVVQLGNPSAFA